jgi:phage terminase large subunit-like protein
MTSFSGDDPDPVHPALNVHTHDDDAGPPPLYGSPRSGRSTAFSEVLEVAAALGITLLPWQRLVLSTALELDDAGRLAYRNVVVSTPRQQGKSMLLFLLVLWRLLKRDDQTVLLGAQTRMAARSRLIDGWWPLLERSPFGEDLSLSRGAGFEALRVANGSILRLLSTEESSGHGESVDLVVVDECWSLQPHVEQAVRPATLARPDPQLWFASTAGTSRSTWWLGKLETGRRAAMEGSESIVHFEWAAPDGANPADPATWRACMPALGITVTEAAVRADFEALNGGPEFVRGYLNRTADGADIGWRVVPADIWESAKWG